MSGRYREIWSNRWRSFNPGSALPNPTFRFREIILVDLKPDKPFNPATLGRYSGISDSEKRVQHRFDARDAVQFDTPFRQLHRKRRRMRPLFLATLNRLVGNEPCVAATAQIASARVRPSFHISFILIRDPERESIDRRFSLGR